ncbi:MAG TPA: LytTR family DNA-binding domain-containing protein [Flavisolibacter sp.]|nr:LytTR family DNA-binding domain-containing protein [Flavisolibacter sp.]
MKLSCIIIEDEPKAMSLLEEYVLRTPFLQLSGQFYNALDALHYLNDNNEVDLIFLDINLPELSGMDLAKSIQPHLKIIFTTAHSDFAVKSYEVNTIDYLLKPITYNRFFQAVLKARSITEKEVSLQMEHRSPSHIFVKSGRKIIQVNWEDIFYIEAVREYISIVTASQKVMVYKRMAEFEAIQPEHFKRIHNSFIVNLDKIEKVEDNLVYMHGRELPVSKSYKDAFYTAIKDRLI